MMVIMMVNHSDQQELHVKKKAHYSLHLLLSQCMLSIVHVYEHLSTLACGTCLSNGTPSAQSFQDFGWLNVIVSLLLIG